MQHGRSALLYGLLEDVVCSDRHATPCTPQTRDDRGTGALGQLSEETKNGVPSAQPRLGHASVWYRTPAVGPFAPQRHNFFFFFKKTPPPKISPFPLHDPLPI